MRAEERLTRLLPLSARPPDPIPWDNAADLLRYAGVEPDATQEALLRSEALDVLVNCNRQWGKSTIKAGKALDRALRFPRSLVLLISPTLRQSGELFAKVLELYADTGQRVKTQQESALTMKLVNGSRIVSLPGAERTVRGYSAVDLLIADEASRIPDSLYYSVRPMLAVARKMKGTGQFLAGSTPFGKVGWFYNEWVGLEDRQPQDINSEAWWAWRQDHDDGVARFRVKATECERIDDEFLAKEALRMPDWWYAQEYNAEFREVVDAVFDAEAIADAFQGEGRALFQAPLDGYLMDDEAILDPVEDRAPFLGGFRR